MKKLQYGLGTFSIFTIFNLTYLFLVDLVITSNTYNFLLWNLFLGFVPYLFALLLKYYSARLGNIFLLLGSFLWLLFYPNAPYMITDLIHVNEKSPTVLYEALLLFSFSMQSLFFGFYSLRLMESILIQRTSKLLVNTFIFGSILLSSFGIYLGRVLRLNSWDVFSSPLKTFLMIWNHLFPISQNPATYSMIILFTFIQLLLLRLIKQESENV